MDSVASEVMALIKLKNVSKGKQEKKTRKLNLRFLYLWTFDARRQCIFIQCLVCERGLVGSTLLFLLSDGASLGGRVYTV